MKWTCLLLIGIMVVGYGWTVYAECKLCSEWTSSYLIRDFFKNRSPVGLWLIGWLCCRLVNACFPEIEIWKVDTLVMGGIFIGHLFWC